MYRMIFEGKLNVIHAKNVIWSWAKLHTIKCHSNVSNTRLNQSSVSRTESGPRKTRGRHGRLHLPRLTKTLLEAGDFVSEASRRTGGKGWHGLWQCNPREGEKETDMVEDGQASFGNNADTVSYLSLYYAPCTSTLTSKRHRYNTVPTVFV